MAQEQLREDRADNANDRVGYDTELRLYSDKEIVRLWQIRFYKEPGYTIPQMKRIFTNPTYQPEIELAEQIRMLEEKKKKIRLRFPGTIAYTRPT